MLKVLDLFSGIGGFSRGLEATGFFETICFVENEPYCQAVLKHHWPEVPILGDIKNVKEPDLPTRPDVICGGFPCQPFSQAGKQKAQDDPRHLWPEMFRLIRECRPTWVVGENVAGLIRLGLDEVLSDLANEGYATRTFNIPACAVGAPHLRQRLWIVAHSDSESEPDKPLDGGAGARQLGFDFGGSEAAPHDSDSDDHGSYRATEYEPDAQHGETQLRDKQVREPGSVGQDVADPEIERAGENNSGLRTRTGGVDRGEGTSRLEGEDVANPESNRNRRKRGAVAGAKKETFREDDGSKFDGGGKDVADPDYSRNRTSRRRVNRDGQKIDEGRQEQPQPQSGRLSKNVADSESVHGEWPVSKGDSRGKPEKKAGGRGRVVGNAQHDGLPSGEGRGRLLDKSEEQERQKEIGKSQGASGSSKDVADSNSKRHGGRSDKERGTEQGIVLSEKSKGRKVGSETEGCNESSRPEEWWEVEPPVGRLVDGLPNRVPQLRALGNSIVPQIAQKIGEAIRETHNDDDGADCQDDQGSSTSTRS